MDIESRKTVWKALLDYKDSSKTMLISTHFMEEADVLADKVAIMVNGKIIHNESTITLKNKFGR